MSAQSKASNIGGNILLIIVLLGILAGGAWFLGKPQMPSESVIDDEVVVEDGEPLETETSIQFTLDEEGVEEVADAIEGELEERGLLDKARGFLNRGEETTDESTSDDEDES